MGGGPAPEFAKALLVRSPQYRPSAKTTPANAASRQPPIERPTFFIFTSCFLHNKESFHFPATDGATFISSSYFSTPLVGLKSLSHTGAIVTRGHEAVPA